MKMQKQNPFYLVIFLFIVAKLFFFTKYMVVLWDESVYIGVGKFIFSFGEVGLIEPIRPVLLPVLLGFLWKINSNIIFLGKLLALGFSIAYICLTYVLARELFNKKVALVSSILISISPLFFFNSIQIMTGIPSTVFALAAIILVIRKKSSWLVGFFCALSFLTRFPQGLLLISVILSYFFVYNRKKFFKNSIKLIFSFFFTTIPFFIFNVLLYKNPFYPFILAFEHQANPVHKVLDGSFLSHVYNILYYMIEPIKDNFLFIFLLIGFFFIFKERLYKIDKVKTSLMILFVYLFYFTCMINKQPRFYLVFFPFLSIIASFGFIELVGKIKSVKNKCYKNYFLKIFFIFIVISLFFVLADNKYSYRWRVVDEPPVQKEFFKYFIDKEAECIFTTDPVPVAYTNKLFIPFYNSAFEANLLFDRFKDKCEYIIYTPDPFPCEFFDDLCYEQKNELISKINSSKERIFHKNYEGQEYNIYI